MGCEPVRRLYDVVGQAAMQCLCGAWYWQWRQVSKGGSTPDMAAIEEAFGRSAASLGRSAFPELRFVLRVDGGTHLLFGMHLGVYAESELARMEAGRRDTERNAPPGGPEFPWLREVEHGPFHLIGSCIETQQDAQHETGGLRLERQSECVEPLDELLSAQA